MPGSVILVIAAGNVPSSSTVLQDVTVRLVSGLSSRGAFVFRVETSIGIAARSLLDGVDLKFFELGNFFIAGEAIAGFLSLGLFTVVAQLSADRCAHSCAEVLFVLFTTEIDRTFSALQTLRLFAIRLAISND